MLDELDKLNDAQEVTQANRKISRLQDEVSRLQKQVRFVERELEESEQRNAFAESLGTPNDLDFESLASLGKGKSTPILVLSDWHAEEPVNPDTVNGRNRFNLDICRKRVESVFRKSVFFMQQLRRISTYDTVVLAVLGDLISGYIHPELVETAQLSPTEACLFAQDLLHSGIKYVKKYCECKHIVVATCFGNHGRTTDKSRVSSAYKNSFEWFMYRNMAQYYKSDKSVKWKVENGYFNWLDLHGRKVRLHHGDYIKYQGGVGGITIPVNKAIAQWNRERVADLDIFGHWHNWQRHRNWICNGSVIGYGAYSIRIKADYQEPAQMLCMVNQSHGCWFGEPIFCEG